MVRKAEPTKSLARVQSGQRVGQQQDVRFERKRAGEAGSLLPVAPQFPWRLVRPQIQRRQLQQGLYLFGCLSHRAIPMVAKRERDVFSDAQMMEQPPALEHQAEAEP